MSQRHFELTFSGIINDPGHTLSDSNLKLNLEYIIQTALSNGFITEDTDAELEDESINVEINDVR